ncbi:hypothetical protein AQJ67_29040 [Streptomyces caeruleatus]|uniref:Uncharacterized protein n=1 Tax=Streptomyces caeruleatus TaxID=661399 RepID=A0A101TT62_9ACTN|nr:hypothetical protein AQJ67_29040 [Streptomyces caeruleatus]
MRQAFLAIGVPRRELGWLVPHVAPDGRPMVAMGMWNADVVHRVAAHLMASPARIETAPDGPVVADHARVTRDD